MLWLQVLGLWLGLGSGLDFQVWLEFFQRRLASASCINIIHRGLHVGLLYIIQSLLQKETVLVTCRPLKLTEFHNRLRPASSSKAQ